ncbi:MAG: hypothetical protein KJS92_08420 [Bacteroidetes bacterium]|nr:hypothetical protein [Bacteroidota bacterium]
MKSLFTIMLLGGTLFFAACKQQCKDTYSIHTGAIHSDYDFGPCFFFSNSLDSTAVIRNQAEFNSFRDRYLKNCADTAKLQTIDFSKHLLLGMNTQFTACNVSYERNITVDTAKKEYRYHVKALRCGGCGTKFREPHWVLGPPLPTGYTLIFSKEIR